MDVIRIPTSIDPVIWILGSQGRLRRARHSDLQDTWRRSRGAGGDRVLDADAMWLLGAPGTCVARVHGAALGRVARRVRL